MLNPCVCRFVVNQKEKYWANHSWRWASGESMAESVFVSGGLRAQKSPPGKKKGEKRENKRQRERQVRGEARGSFSAALHMTERWEQCAWSWSLFWHVRLGPLSCPPLLCLSSNSNSSTESNTEVSCSPAALHQINFCLDLIYRAWHSTAAPPSDYMNTSGFLF